MATIKFDDDWRGHERNEIIECDEMRYSKFVLLKAPITRLDAPPEPEVEEKPKSRRRKRKSELSTADKETGGSGPASADDSGDAGNESGDTSGSEAASTDS